MTSYVHSSRSTTTYNLAAGDGLLVTRQGSIRTTVDAAHALLGAGANKVTIEGSLSTTGQGTDAAHFEGPNNTVVIASSGTLVAYKGDGIRFSMGGNTLTNSGLINGYAEGVLFGPGAASTLNNYSTILGGFDGIYAFGQLTIVNNGTIEGLIGDGIDNASSTIASRITNNGSIYGREDNGFDLGSGNDFVANNGFIIGENGSNLGDGNDIYDGRLGQHIGTVFGQAGNDTLRGGAFVDRFEGDAGEDLLFGGGGADLLFGGMENDLLDGQSGADRMNGGPGNDKFYVDAAGDVVADAAEAGSSDRVLSSISYTLAAGAEIELFTTTSSAGTGALNLVGNEYNQRIIGNAGANTINGGGGIDLMEGLNGSDRYFVDLAGDMVKEAVGGGTDDVLASVSYTLKAGVEVEKLSTTDTSASNAINLAGNEFAQQILGNQGVNKLLGYGGNDQLFGYGGSDALYGGLGVDKLTGGLGNDAFVFDTALGNGNIDTITDFTVTDDTVRLENAVFTSLAAGTLVTSQFARNLTGQAQDANDRIIYETDTGRIFYDADGIGGATGIHFATMTANLAALAYTDFLVV